MAWLCFRSQCPVSINEQGGRSLFVYLCGRRTRCNGVADKEKWNAFTVRSCRQKCKIFPSSDQQLNHRNVDWPENKGIWHSQRFKVHDMAWNKKNGKKERTIVARRYVDDLPTLVEKKNQSFRRSVFLFFLWFLLNLKCRFSSENWKIMV